MMDPEHMITPPKGLVRQLQDLEPLDAIERAYRAGADWELGASVAWLISKQNPRWALALQEGRRPEPPSLKAQALDSWDRLRNEAWCEEIDFDLDFIRRALEQLDD